MFKVIRLVALAMLLPLAACSSGDGAVSSQPTPSPTSQQVTQAKPTSKQSPVAPINYTVQNRPLRGSCKSTDYRETTVTSLSQALSLSPEMRKECSVSFLDSSVSLPEEEAALQASGSAKVTLKGLYGICMRPSIYNDSMTSLSESQLAEAKGVLALCPKFEDAERLQQLITAGEADRQLEASGQKFAGGTYRIGSDIQPGTYYSEWSRAEGNFDSCYWELLDSAGNIIDNNFVSGALRVEITVPADAYSLSVQACGTFRPIA